MSILKQGIITVSGNNINDNILLNSATLTGKDDSIINNNITTGVHTGISGWKENRWSCSLDALNNPLSGKKITISLDFMCTDISKINAMVYGFGIIDNSNTRLSDVNLYVSSYSILDGSIANNTWSRIYYVYTIPTDWATNGTKYILQIKTNSNANGITMYHKRIKVEISDHPTPWCISSSDYSFTQKNGFIENQNYNNPDINTKIGNGWIACSNFNEI